MSRHECQNCGRDWSDEEIEPIIKRIHERVAPGEPMPSGECPECGALTHQVNYYKQKVVEERLYAVEYVVAAASLDEAKNKVAIGETVQEGPATLNDITNREPDGKPELVDAPAEVALIPGLSTPEGQTRTAEKLHLRNELDYQCYMMLARMCDEGMLREGHGEDDTLPRPLRKEIRELVDARVKANDELIYAISGRE